MISKIKFCLIIIFIFQYNLVFSSDFKIIAKINNEILTNFDIQNEKKYLFFINANLQNLSNNEIYRLSKNSLIKQTIKKEEIKKYFQLKEHKQLEEALLRESLTKQGFSNEKDYSIFLKDKGVNLKFFKERMLIDRLWNSLIYEKFKNKIKINKTEIKEKVTTFIKNKKTVYEYNLSEILYETTTDYEELKKFIEKYGFETAAHKYSISETSTSGGKIGWIKINNLNEKLKFQISNLNRGQMTSPIKIPNGNLLLKVNEKKELKSKINIDEEINKQIKYEQNRQLNNFSLNFYKKIKQNKTINEY